MMPSKTLGRTRLRCATQLRRSSQPSSLLLPPHRPLPRQHRVDVLAPGTSATGIGLVNNPGLPKTGIHFSKFRFSEQFGFHPGIALLLHPAIQFF